MREVILDTETTGLDPLHGHRITEIGCVEVLDCVPTGRTFHSYVNPERDVPSEVVDITGLTTAFLRDKPLFEDVVADLLAFVGGDRVIAHNAPFDRKFVNAELSRIKQPPIPDKRWMCTAELARSMLPGAQVSLDALCRRFNISLEKRDKHGALIDAQLLAEVYLQLNGGRERKLDFGETSAAAAARAASAAPKSARPEPLPSLITAAEADAHAAFVKKLGEAAFWLKVES
jgi:DNA polymerase-3 subunit epsilon